MVSEADPKALAQAVEYLWANQPLRAQLAERGYRNVVERFSLERTGEQLRRLFA